jgi:hypothetical protein
LSFVPSRVYMVESTGRLACNPPSSGLERTLSNQCKVYVEIENV